MLFKSSLKKELFTRYFISYLLITLLLIVISFISLVFYPVIVSDFNKLTTVSALNEKLIKSPKEISAKELAEVDGFLLIVNSNGEYDYSLGQPLDFNNPLTFKDYQKILGITKEYTTIAGSELLAFITMTDVLSTKYIEKTGKEYYLYSYNLSNTNQFVIFGFPSYFIKGSNFYNKHKYTVTSLLIIGLFVVICVLILFSIITANPLIKPITSLIDSVSEMSSGNYSIRLSNKSKNELGLLVDGFNKMAETIENQRDDKNRLIVDISHDLKNPLSSIVGYSDLLISNNHLSPEEKINYLSIINSNSKRCNKLINNLFEVSLLQSCDYLLTLQKTDICECLRLIMADFVNEFEDKYFKYTLTLPNNEVFLNLDSTKFERAISNIIENSLKYNPIKTEFSITGTYTKDFFLITIEDNGIGIPHDFKESIFQPFIRISNNTNSSGTGLGLSISKLIIEKHNGSILLVNSSGTKFKIKLPY